MIALWQDVFAGRSDVVIDAASHFFELGGDSMQAARLLARIDRELGRALPLAALFEAPTPRRLVNRMTDEKWQAPWSPLVAVQPYGHRPPLFFLAGGGGNVINYGILADCLSHEQPVYCLQARGLAPGEQPLAAVEEMADNYLEAIRRFRPRGPYLLAGHSLGAVVAYEIAQRVVREGDEVPLLALFDHPGPDIRLTRADWLRYHLINLSMLDRRDRVQYVVVGLSWRFRFLRALRRTVTGPARKTAPDHRIGWNSVEMLEHALRALRNYRIRPYPGRVTLFRARQGSPRILADPHGGWGRVAGAGVDVVEVPGTHLTMLTEPHVRTLGRAFADYLERLPSTAVQETR